MKVKFLPSGEEHEIEFNETVLHLAQRHDIHIQSVCKGLPSCAECRVRIIDGEHHVLPPSSKEIALIGTAHYVDMSRLSCQLRCFGDLTVNLDEQIEKESRAQKAPKSRQRNDGQASKAITGNIFEVSEDFDEDLDQQSTNSEKGQRRSFKKVESLDKRDDFYGSFYKDDGKGKSKSSGGKKKKSKNSSRNSSKHRTKSAARKGGEPSSEQSGESRSEPTAGKKKSRNRNRNRNRNRSKANPAQKPS